MPFKSYRPQPLFDDPCADAYAQAALDLSRLAALQTRTRLDVCYGANPDQLLDIYLPAAVHTGPLPVFINIHGGGWTHGHKEWMGLNAPPVVAAPALYVSVAYRLAPAHRHPAQLEDCLAALAWVHVNIAEFGGDPQRIHIGGHSAGGHLAALVALRRELYPRFGLPADVIRGCFPFSGIYNLTGAALEGVPPANYASPILAQPGDAADASPAAFLSGNRIPFFVSWAQNDNPVCKEAGPAFAAALGRQPGPIESHEFRGLDHFWIHIDQQRPANLWTRTLLGWMQAQGSRPPKNTDESSSARVQ